MSYTIELWLLNDTFIDRLKDQYDSFVRTKLNELWDFKNKDMITEVNLDELIDQIITHALNYNLKNKNNVENFAISSAKVSRSRKW